MSRGLLSKVEIRGAGATGARELATGAVGSARWPNSREFGNRQRRRRKTKLLIRVVYNPTHTLLGLNCFLKY